jgi:hypothetical protein
VFGFAFAVNSSVHSYLVLAYAGSEKAAEDVGFYYAANALGRFFGTLLSGLLYQWGGLVDAGAAVADAAPAAGHLALVGAGPAGLTPGGTLALPLSFPEPPAGRRTNPRPSPVLDTSPAATPSFLEPTMSLTRSTTCSSSAPTTRPARSWPRRLLNSLGRGASRPLGRQPPGAPCTRSR